MKPDLIICQPRHLDFPLWRKFIRDNRFRFNKIIVVFTHMNVSDVDYRQFVQDSLREDNVIFLDCLPAEADEDWRNKAVNMALTVSDSEWVWFTEQDFTALDGFWDAVEKASKVTSVIWVEVGERPHPCCIFIKRDLIEKTSKNFGVVRDVSDHFSIFTKEIRDQFPVITIERGWHHMNGLSQNLRMLQLGEEPNYNPEEFKEYCKRCLEIDSIHPDFKALFEKYLEK